MEYTNYVFLMHDKTKGFGKQVTLLTQNKVRIYREANGTVSGKTNDEIARKLGISYKGAKRLDPTMVELPNGKRISWRKEIRWGGITVEADTYACLYKIVNDKLQVKTGVVKPVADRAVFYVLNEKGKAVERYQVSAHEREVHNNAVWLADPDEEVAAAAFIQNCNQQIDEYAEKMRKLGEKVNIMKRYIKAS